jgi:hypothetical protein
MVCAPQKCLSLLNAKVPQERNKRLSRNLLEQPLELSFAYVHPGRHVLQPDPFWIMTLDKLKDRTQALYRPLSAVEGLLTFQEFFIVASKQDKNQLDASSDVQANDIRRSRQVLVHELHKPIDLRGDARAGTNDIREIRTVMEKRLEILSRVRTYFMCVDQLGKKEERNNFDFPG